MNRRAHIFANGENLLVQCYEINAGYPMPKATVNGGVNVNFLIRIIMKVIAINDSPIKS
ncbi:hypothetical protein LPYR103PRE_22460 [Segatella asaccharophila]